MPAGGRGLGSSKETVCWTPVSRATWWRLSRREPPLERRPRPRTPGCSPLRPRSLRDFLAFEGHLKNAFKRLNRPIPEEWYEVPAFYRGMPDTVIGPEETVPWPSYTDRLDHELELAAVIGRRGKDVPR